jgi:hypothetical protein
MQVTIGSLLSLLLALFYVIGYIAASGGFDVGVCRRCLYLLIPLALIWFPDELGGFTGYTGRGGNIDTPSPSILISFFGWFFLVGVPVLGFWFGQ